MHWREVQLPLSKSISNRLLIIHALMGEIPERNKFSSATDTTILFDALNQNENEINVGAAGTAMRFLTAYYAIQQGEKKISGDGRMKERPIEDLVKVLREMGAAIEYAEKEGFPPLIIKGQNLVGRQFQIAADVSSQFISALLLIAPYLKNGLQLTLKNEIISRTYIEMTIALMQKFGAAIVWEENVISVGSGKYQKADFMVEADWSAASYFYSIVALSKESKIFLKGLHEESIQGDAIVAALFSELGVETIFKVGGAEIFKVEKELPKELSIDFTDFPDLTMTFAVLLPALGIKAELKGLKTLRIKESDRIRALKTELEKIGQEVRIEGDQLRIHPGRINGEVINIDTYHDHRMAMAFAPLAVFHKNIKIQSPEVVKKSFPDFWEALTTIS